MEIKDFAATIKEAMRAHGFSEDRLGEETGIAPRHLRALFDHDTDNLPAAPYVRGYIQNIAEVLDLNGDQLWSEYTVTQNIKRSGVDDTLPINRFAQRAIHKKWIFIAIIGLIVIAYAIPKVANFFGRPSLEITTPAVDKITVDNQLLTISGRIANRQDKVTINDEEIVVRDDGAFEKEVPLSEGINTFEIKASRFLGSQMIVERTVIYQSKAVFKPAAGTTTSATSSVRGDYIIEE
ncbi:MAG: helix-turn-helix domain-containing protein [Candidatus Pacebacteria bacterium]|nr:helix-turn-helix domain-containing protein [Candidatus Paceibacterota bacterium]